MIFESPLQLYADRNFCSHLKDIQLRWKSGGVQAKTIGSFIATTSGEIQGIQHLIQWLSYPMIYAENAMRTLMSMRDDRGANVFEEGFLNYLQRFRFKGDIWIIADKTMIFAGTPILQLCGNALCVDIVRHWITYLLQPPAEYKTNANFLQIRRFYNSEYGIIKDIIFPLEQPPIVNFEAASWEDLLQPVNIVNTKS